MKRNDNRAGNTFITQATDVRFLQSRYDDLARFSLHFSASVAVYDVSLVILSKYFRADLQRRKEEFEGTIFVNLCLSALGLGGVSSDESMLKKGHKKDVLHRKKKDRKQQGGIQFW